MARLRLLAVEKRAINLFAEKQVAEESLATVTSNAETTLLASSERARALEEAMAMYDVVDRRSTQREKRCSGRET